MQESLLFSMCSVSARGLRKPRSVVVCLVARSFLGDCSERRAGEEDKAAQTSRRSEYADTRNVSEERPITLHWNGFFRAAVPPVDTGLEPMSSSVFASRLLSFRRIPCLRISTVVCVACVGSPLLGHRPLPLSFFGLLFSVPSKHLPNLRLACLLSRRLILAFRKFVLVCIIVQISSVLAFNGSLSSAVTTGALPRGILMILTVQARRPPIPGRCLVSTTSAQWASTQASRSAASCADAGIAAAVARRR